MQIQGGSSREMRCVMSCRLGETTSEEWKTAEEAAINVTSDHRNTELFGLKLRSSSSRPPAMDKDTFH